ncbi:hypothetical protein V8E36_009749 [Tilletia maclaganii]
MGATTRAPVWFIAHGGPPTLFQTEHPAYKHWVKIGDDIRQAKLKGIVVISAHWQAKLGTLDPKVVQINTDPSNPMLYDYWNFDAFFYKLAFHSRNPPSFSSKVADTLAQKGFRVEKTRRGIDHGVFIPLKACFKDELAADSPHVVNTGIAEDSGRDGLPDDIPLVQLSLPDEIITGQRAAEASIALGRALRDLRDQGIGIILGGQPVHNLRIAITNFRTSKPDPKTGLFPPDAFGQAFSSAISTALLTKEGGELGRDQRTLDLLKHPAYKLAHPSDDHFLPIAVAVGASYADEPVEEATPIVEGGMAWNMYRWGATA